MNKKLRKHAREVKARAAICQERRKAEDKARRRLAAMEQKRALKAAQQEGV